MYLPVGLARALCPGFFVMILRTRGARRQCEGALPPSPMAIPPGVFGTETRPIGTGGGLVAQVGLV